ncbi:MAG: hypothetical protein JSR09_03660 [Bacteroidetes bacterium]|nr:hypothetical protein [Bacteroidota bacterium]MBS1648780.1 hypothetical protein [Bacteroidota bacterium]
MKLKWLIILLFTPFVLLAQDAAQLMKEAINFEYQFKETEALAKYKQILINEPNNMKALLKSTELSCSTGERLPIKNDKRLTFESALSYAKRMLAIDSNNANSYYAMALANSKMAEIETENKKIIAFIRDVKINADIALKLNPNHAMANFIEGKWQYDMINYNWLKKLAAKTLYGGLAEPSLDNAIQYLEKCKSIEPYFVLNSLILAKAYRDNNNPAKAIETLQQTIKLPTRTIDDPAYKAEAQKLLDALQ